MNGIRIFVTGASGFVGRYIIENLRLQNYEIVVLKNKSKVIAEEEYVEANLTDDDFAQKVYSNIQRCDVIIHVAAEISDQNKDSLIKTNILGMLHIIDLANLWDVKQFIFMSSVPVIGIPETKRIDESHQVNPTTLYHSTKYWGEQMLKLLANDSMAKLILRIPSPIGCGMRNNTIFSVFVKNALDNKDIILKGTGARVQNYIDVRDVANCVRRGIEITASGIYILGGTSISNLDLAKIICNVLQSESVIKFDGDDPEENVRWNLSTEKLREELKFEQQYTIQDTIFWLAKR